MTPALIIAAITETARLLNSEQGQRFLKDVLDGAGATEKAIERVTGAIEKLFHH